MNSKLLYGLLGIIAFVIFGLGLSLMSETKDKVIVEEQTTEVPVEQTLEIEQYIPLVKDNLWIYTINGDDTDRLMINIEFIKENVIQVRFDSDYKDIIKVYTKQEDGLYEVASITGTTQKTDYTMTRQYKRPILKQPLEEGNSWVVMGDERATLQQSDVAYEGVAGRGNAIKVVYEDDGIQTTAHYTEKLGLAALEIETKEKTTKLTLQELKINSTMKQLIDVYYGDYETNKLEKVTQEIGVMTNEEPKHFLTDVLKITHDQKYIQTLPADAFINALYHDVEKNTVFVDVNKPYIEQNNEPKQQRLAILSLVNTVGSYYKAEYIHITVDGEPYTAKYITYDKEKGIKVDHN